MPDTHVHKYQLLLWGRKKTPIFKCMLDDCTHYVMQKLALNRTSICWKCGRHFKLTKAKLTRKKPKCDYCSGKINVLNRLDELIGGLDES
jgi:DNA-directed RNA polymerase subunit RPC12/RpoP